MVKCVHRQKNATLEVPAICLVRNVSILYGDWWLRLAGVTCIVIHLSHPLTATTKDSHDENASEPERAVRILRFLRGLLFLVVGKEGQREAQERKEGKKTLHVGTTTMEKWFEGIGLEMSQQWRSRLLRVLL